VLEKVSAPGGVQTGVDILQQETLMRYFYVDGLKLDLESANLKMG